MQSVFSTKVEAMNRCSSYDWFAFLNDKSSACPFEFPSFAEDAMSSSFNPYEGWNCGSEIYEMFLKAEESSYFNEAETPYNDAKDVDGMPRGICHKKPRAAEELPSDDLEACFLYTPIIVLDSLMVSIFKRKIADASMQPLTAWPQEVPSRRRFFGVENLGVVDFGGKKAGTLYDAGDNYGFLVKYAFTQ